MVALNYQFHERGNQMINFNYFKKTCFLLISFLPLTCPINSAQADVWTESFKKTFIQECIDGAGDEMPLPITTSICYCGADKVLAKYSTQELIEIEEGTPLQIKDFYNDVEQFGLECAKEDSSLREYLKQQIVNGCMSSFENEDVLEYPQALKICRCSATEMMKKYSAEDFYLLGTNTAPDSLAEQIFKDSEKIILECMAKN